MTEAKIQNKGDSRMTARDIQELIDRVSSIEAVSNQNHAMLSRLFQKFDNIHEELHSVKSRVVENTINTHANSRFIYSMFWFTSLIVIGFITAIITGSVHLSTV